MRLTALLLPALVFCACHKPAGGAPAPSPAPSADAAAPGAKELFDGGVHERSARLEAIVREWNAAINAHDADKLGALYADEIELYGERMTRARAVAAKRAAFAAHARDDVTNVAVGDERATFHKKSALKSGKVIEVTGYLDVEAGKIVSEGDTTTDKNLARAKQVSCEDAVLALVDNTPEAEKAAKEIEEGAKKLPEPVNVGGMIIPPEHAGGTWYVGVCENWPERMPCYHRFFVDPATAKVTYEAYADDARPIAVDPARAATVRNLCKRE